jgi:hypothetical protein
MMFYWLATYVAEAVRGLELMLKWMRRTETSGLLNGEDAIQLFFDAGQVRVLGNRFSV